jgi:hypothetical protein
MFAIETSLRACAIFLTFSGCHEGTRNTGLLAEPTYVEINHRVRGFNGYEVLTSYPYSGHSVLIGKVKRKWQETAIGGHGPGF